MNLASLSPFKHEGIWCTRGRYGSELGRILGPEQLPILPATSNLAKCIMHSAHSQAHRGGADTCFRSRSIAWIIRARPLADRVSNECAKCPFLWKTRVQQRMGNLPEERLRIGEKPWTSVAIDFFGPYQIKAIPQGRALCKVWPVIFGCMNTGALHVELCSGYGADAFLQSYTNFTSLRGAPSKVYTDKGSQLVRASENVTESPEKWNWSQVEDKTSTDLTTWRFCPPASQWRNGLAESRVRAMKEGLDQLLPAGAKNLSFSEFQTVMRKLTNSINDRPLGIKTNGEGEILPLTPNSLLLGRSSLQPHSLVDSEDENRLVRRTKFVEEVEQSWWRIWFVQCWKDLFPRNSWKVVSENLRPGDICLKGYNASLGPNRYVLCRVTKTFPDEDQLVRTVEVESRPRDSREKSLPYLSKDLVKERMSVQRLVIICRKENIPDAIEDSPTDQVAPIPLPAPAVSPTESLEK